MGPGMTGQHPPGPDLAAGEDNGCHHAQQHEVEGAEEPGRHILQRALAHDRGEAVERGDDQHQPRSRFAGDRPEGREHIAASAVVHGLGVQQPGAAYHQGNPGESLQGHRFPQQYIAGDRVEDRREGQVGEGE